MTIKLSSAQIILSKDELIEKSLEDGIIDLTIERFIIYDEIIFEGFDKEILSNAGITEENPRCGGESIKCNEAVVAIVKETYKELGKGCKEKYF